MLQLSFFQQLQIVAFIFLLVSLLVSQQICVYSSFYVMLFKYYLHGSKTLFLYGEDEVDGYQEMANQGRSEIYVVVAKILCGANFRIW